MLVSACAYSVDLLRDTSWSKIIDVMVVRL